MDERAKADMAAIKGRVADARQAIANGVNDVEIGQFTTAQLGLAPVVVDAAGRLWRHEPGRLVLIDPKAPFQRR
jgi:hypothetical protein